MNNKNEKLRDCVVKLCFMIVYEVLFLYRFHNFEVDYNFGMFIVKGFFALWFATKIWLQIVNIIGITQNVEPTDITLDEAIVSIADSDAQDSFTKRMNDSGKLTSQQKTLIHNAMREMDYYKTTSTHKYFEDWKK